MTKTITLAPLSCYFSNENREMRLRPHMHYASVQLTLRTVGRLGFPVFEETVQALHKVLEYLTEHPFRDSTNEVVADTMYEVFNCLLTDHGAVHTRLAGEEGEAAWQHALSTLQKWGGDYQLHELSLAVMGSPDRIGHSDGWATYTVRAD